MKMDFDTTTKYTLKKKKKKIEMTLDQKVVKEISNI